MDNYIEVSNIQLLLASLFVIIASLFSVIYHLKLEKSLIIGSIRTVIQLILLGYILQILFVGNHPFLTFIMYMLMLVFAAFIIASHAKKRNLSFVRSVFLSMFISSALISVFVVKFIMLAEPWWRAQYFLPIVGMIIGNSMTALSIAIERYISDYKSKKKQVEMMLCLGASQSEALHILFVDALKAGMVPSINSLMGAGIVFIPGMMSGQILAGIDPIQAAKYQIIVMLMLVASSAISSFLCLKWLQHKII